MDLKKTFAVILFASSMVFVYVRFVGNEDGWISISGQETIPFLTKEYLLQSRLFPTGLSVSGAAIKFSTTIDASQNIKVEYRARVKAGDKQIAGYFRGVNGSEPANPTAPEKGCGAYKASLRFRLHDADRRFLTAVTTQPFHLPKGETVFSHGTIDSTISNEIAARVKSVICEVHFVDCED